MWAYVKRPECNAGFETVFVYGWYPSCSPCAIDTTAVAGNSKKCQACPSGQSTQLKTGSPCFVTENKSADTGVAELAVKLKEAEQLTTIVGGALGGALAFTIVIFSLLYATRKNVSSQENAEEAAAQGAQAGAAAAVTALSSILSGGNGMTIGGGSMMNLQNLVMGSTSNFGNPALTMRPMMMTQRMASQGRPLGPATMMRGLQGPTSTMGARSRSAGVLNPEDMAGGFDLNLPLRTIGTGWNDRKAGLLRQAGDGSGPLSPYSPISPGQGSPQPFLSSTQAIVPQGMMTQGMMQQGMMQQGMMQPGQDFILNYQDGERLPNLY